MFKIGKGLTEYLDDQDPESLKWALIQFLVACTFFVAMCGIGGLVRLLRSLFAFAFPGL